MRISRHFKSRYAHKWSARRESNPPEAAWEAAAIPLGDSRIFTGSIAKPHSVVKRKSCHFP